MQTVHKYPLGEPRRVLSITMPEDAEILYVDTQREAPCLWARVDTSKPMQERYFILAGTGHDTEGAGDYIGTFMIAEGTFVFHLFEALREGISD